MRSIKPKLRKSQSSSAAVVASDDDLLIHILLRLPVKSLLQFKCVSKHWLSLITSPYFTKLRIRHPIPASGLLLDRCLEHDFVSFDTRNPSKPQFRKLTFPDEPSSIRILQSCNGLLLCCSFHGSVPSRNYYICNPTTRQYSTLPKPEKSYPWYLNLAYDPSKSTHYKVVGFRGYELMSWNYKSSWYYQIEVYSSETRQWRVTSQSNKSRGALGFNCGVYWNGAIHWVIGLEHTLFFDIDQEKLEKTRIPLDSWEESRIEYFGESCDHLHLIRVNSRHATLFNIFEMERDRTRWSLLYHVNLDAVVSAYPHVIRRHIPPTDYHHYGMFVLCLIRGEKEEDSFMVLNIPRKAIRYNLVDKSFQVLRDFPSPVYPSHALDEGDELEFFSVEYHSSSAFQYIESLCIF